MKVEDSKKPLNAAIRQAFNENPHVSSVHQPEFQVILRRVHELLPGWNALTYEVLREKASRYLYYYRYWTKKRTGSGISYSNLDDSLNAPSSCTPDPTASINNSFNESCASNSSTNTPLSVSSRPKKQIKRVSSYVNELVREVCQNAGEDFFTRRKECILELAGRLRNIFHPEIKSMTDEELQKKITRFMYNSRRIPKLKAVAARSNNDLLDYNNTSNGPNTSNSNSPSSLSESDILCIKQEMSDSYYEDSMTEFDSHYASSVMSRSLPNGAPIMPSASANYYNKPSYRPCIRQDDSRSLLKRKPDYKYNSNPKQVCGKSGISYDRNTESTKHESFSKDDLDFDPANDSFDLDDNLLMTNMEKMEYDKHDMDFDEESQEFEFSDNGDSYDEKLEGGLEEPDKSYHRFMFRRRNMRRRLVKRRSERLARPVDQAFPIEDDKFCVADRVSSSTNKEVSVLNSSNVPKIQADTSPSEPKSASQLIPPAKPIDTTTCNSVSIVEDSVNVKTTDLDNSVSKIAVKETNGLAAPSGDENYTIIETGVDVCNNSVPTNSAPKSADAKAYKDNSSDIESLRGTPMSESNGICKEGTSVKQNGNGKKGQIWKLRTGDQVDVIDEGVKVAVGILAAPVSDLLEDETECFSFVILREKLKDDVVMPFLNESSSWNKLKEGDWFFWPASKVQKS